MGGSRRKLKRSKPKVQVGLPKKKAGVFKPAFSFPPKLLAQNHTKSQWDDKGSVIQNYKSFGLLSNPNLLSVRSRTPHILQSDSLQAPPPPIAPADSELPDSGSELEEDGQSLIYSFCYDLLVFHLLHLSSIMDNSSTLLL